MNDDLNRFDEHHQFYGTNPEPNETPEPDAALTKRQAIRNIVTRVFVSPEGAECLAILRKLAGLEAMSPINDPVPERADRMLWYREGRQDLIREIEAMCKEERGR
jgi:hypothetical protein